MAGHHTEDRGYALHKSIAPDRWCVTSWDLEFLGRQVKRAIHKGRIQPHPLDNFKACDGYGPSIYTVNEQHIKPETSRAGKMSWALMMNPDGLDCDLFISHAWQEGVFEFLMKVIGSWPSSMRHAWCCMLANPQNLNIGALLQSPKDSPFALALEASKLVLVVPNRQRSVYTRLWCAYEAYLAQASGKDIIIARTPRIHVIRAAVRSLTPAVCAGVTLGIISEYFWHHDMVKITWVTSIMGFIVFSVQNDKVRLALNFIGEMLCWLEMLHWRSHRNLKLSHVRGADLVTCLVVWSIFATFFFLMEVDRIRVVTTHLEAQQLQRGYQGSIRHAECSQVSDAANIRSEIGGKEDAVDYAIHVLLTVGLSTPALRDIALAGVDLEHAAYSEITAAVIFMGPFEVLTLLYLAFYIVYLHGSWHTVFMQIMTLLAKLTVIWIFHRSPPDEQIFLLKVTARFTAGLLTLLGLSLSLRMSTLCTLWFLTSQVCTFVLLSFALLGICGTAQLPFGLCLLQLVFAKGSRTFLKYCCKNFCKSCRSLDMTDEDFLDSPDTDSSSDRSSAVD